MIHSNFQSKPNQSPIRAKTEMTANAKNRVKTDVWLKSMKLITRKGIQIEIKCQLNGLVSFFTICTFCTYLHCYDLMFVNLCKLVTQICCLIDLIGFRVYAPNDLAKKLPILSILKSILQRSVCRLQLQSCHMNSLLVFFACIESQILERNTWYRLKSHCLWNHNNEFFLIRLCWWVRYHAVHLPFRFVSSDLRMALQGFAWRQQEDHQVPASWLIWTESHLLARLPAVYLTLSSFS